MSLTVFSGADEAFLTELRFYVIVQQAEKEEPVYWFRMYSRQKELAHSHLFGIMMQPGQFDQVREPMFLFDQYFRLRCDGRGLCSSFGGPFPTGGYREAGGGLGRAAIWQKVNPPSLRTQRRRCLIRDAFLGRSTRFARSLSPGSADDL